jgi:flagellar hook-associated protein 3 FlgL
MQSTSEEHMAGIPSNLTRVPNSLASRLALSNITGTNIQILKLQEQLATQRSILRPSDDIVRAATIGVLDDRLERSSQLVRNYQHASAALGVLDNLFNEASTTALEARDIALEQSNVTSSTSERESQATVIDQMLRSLYNTANRQGVAGFALGGTTPNTQPVTDFFGYFRFNSQGQGLTTDLDQVSSIPITLGAGPIAGRSSRVSGSVDLNPRLTNDTKLSDLTGGRGLGVATGPIEFSVDGGARVQINLAGSDTIRDVADKIQSAIRSYETANSVTVLDPSGVSISGENLAIDIRAGVNVEFFEVGTGVTARDLGLTTTPVTVFSATNENAASLAPKLTWRTPISALAGVTGPLGTVRISNAGRSANVDLSTAATFQDIKNAIEASNLGVKVTINPAGTGIDVVNEVAAGSNNALSISEVSGGTTATRLGIRSFSGVTRISDFNFGRGVQVMDGVADPTTGAISTALNTDFTIRVGNPPPATTGTTLTIDFKPTDMGTVQNVLDVMNAQIATQLAAASLPSTTLRAQLASDGNGFVFVQDTTLPPGIAVETLNNSSAAEQLGLLKGSFNTGTRTYSGEDRAKVRIESLFSHLVDLRESLRTNDLRGIGFASNDLERINGQTVDARGLVGSYAQRVDEAERREQDRATLDESTRSQVRDLDFTAAATRFQTLQTQLEAGLRATSLTQQLSLLDFLG